MERSGMAGAGSRSITEAIDSMTPASRMMMQMVGAFAEFERAMIRERISAGLAGAPQAAFGGRCKKLEPSRGREIAEAPSLIARPVPRWRGSTMSAHRPFTHRRHTPRQLCLAAGERQSPSTPTKSTTQSWRCPT
jgi:hypothetical protein